MRSLREILDDHDHRMPTDVADELWGLVNAEPTKRREGDQVLPTGDESLVDDQALLIQDIEERRQVGIERYGQGHRPFNGRDTLQDLYEEQLDLLVYLRSIKRMAEVTREELIQVAAKAFHPEPDGEDEANAMIAVDAIMGWVAGRLMDGEANV